MHESLVTKLRERITRFLRGPRCRSHGQPLVDDLMQQWIDGVLLGEPAARCKLKVASERRSELLPNQGGHS